MAFDFSDFDAHVASAKVEIFRFEWLRLYGVASDLEEFKRWQQGEPTAADDPDNDYYVRLRKKRSQGVKQVRVRIADFPVHDYLRYEIAFYRGSIEHGEEIFMLERALAVQCMQTTVVAGDYWLFDRERALLFNYDEGGELVGQQWVEPADVPKYVALRDVLEREAMPLESFIERYPESFG